MITLNTNLTHPLDAYRTAEWYPLAHLFFQSLILFKSFIFLKFGLLFYFKYFVMFNYFDIKLKTN